jgi:hypothetical protein
MQPAAAIIASSVGPKIIIWLPVERLASISAWIRGLGTHLKRTRQPLPLKPNYQSARQPLDRRGLSSDNLLL